MRTREQLISAVLEILVNLPTADAPDPEDYLRVDNKVAPAIKLLAGKRIIFLGDDQEFEDEVFLPLSQFTANVCVGSFGITGEKKAEIERDALKAERDLRIITQNGPSYAVMEGQYF